MRYTSTAGRAPAVGFREAVLAGPAPDGGLYVPGELPRIPADLLTPGPETRFAELAARLLLPFVDGELAAGEVAAICADAFDFPVPLVPVAGGIHALELFHGPTLAFKDFGARFLARVLERIATGASRRLTVLVATSGDTGSAVARAFAGREGVRVVLLYPAGRVSELQQRQLTTAGDAVTALEVEGTFDDCQSLVKAMLADGEVRERCSPTSANSINVGRLLPQLVYYVHAWRRLARSPGETVTAAVPSGNLGNLTGALLARLMGLPLARLLVATNANDGVARLLAGGEWAPRPVVATPANAMDVAEPSNLARVRALLGDDPRRLREVLAGEAVSTPEILATIGRVQRETGYTLDPHSAVAMRALERHAAAGALDGAVAFLAATAHPGKFAEVVRTATGCEVEMPESLRSVLGKPGKAVRMAPSAADLKDLLLGLR